MPKVRIRIRSASGLFMRERNIRDLKRYSASLMLLFSPAAQFWIRPLVFKTGLTRVSEMSDLAGDTETT
jgi:hypothetical protein